VTGGDQSPVAPPLDALARDYLLLALAAGNQFDGVVDAYYGPPELRAAADARTSTPAELATQAAALRGRVLADEPDAQRRDWLDRQLVALETILRRLAGEEIGYLEEVERCFDIAPAATPDDVYDGAFAALEELLPAGDNLAERVEQRGRRLTIPIERLPAVVDWLVKELRTASLRHFPAPVGEELAISLVSGQPWSAYNWYDGSLSSRIEINTDLPVRAGGLIGTLSHECFPGHHLEHAWKEQRLYREQGRAEASVLLINTPEAYISEGLAELGESLIIDREQWTALLAGVCARAGLELSTDELAGQWQISQALDALHGVGSDAALLLHHQRRPREEVIDFIERRALRTRMQAEQTLGFIDHPLWRTYVFCYAGGKRLLTEWCAAAGEPAAQRDRFLRLLTEQLTPSGIAAELGRSAAAEARPA
jgi:hypothetical protein